MNRVGEYLLVFILAVIVCSVTLGVHYRDTLRVNEQAVIIEKLQGDVMAMTSAFGEISLELLRSQYAYSSWSIEIDRLRDAMGEAPEIPPIGRWENRKEATKGVTE